MSERPWITIVGLGEDGLDGLPSASLRALEMAEVILGPKRHIDLLGARPQRMIVWPVPFNDGLALLRKEKGKDVVVLASGDPFWFGAGSVIARHFDPDEWRTLPGPSTFSTVANRLGWPLETTICLGLHAAPLSRMRPHLTAGAKAIVLLRDGAAVLECAQFLTDAGFGASSLTVFEAVAGPNEKRTCFDAHEPPGNPFAHPVCVAVNIAGSGAVVPCASGIPDAFFETDGVMTKRSIRAVTLSSLAPRAGECLWDIGGGSGSIAIEWLLAHRSCSAVTIEPRADRVALISKNAAHLGVDRLQIVSGSAPEAMTDLPLPDAVFIGGGLSAVMLADLQERLPKGTRLVANAVTFEAEALLIDLHSRKGGELIRLDVSHAKPLGHKHAWDAAYPVVQWSGVL
ncbi:MAG: precorrin-6y C5,15-methyltransferase (decarboxylating) subunit CbiE [Roseobacter sp.]